MHFGSPRNLVNFPRLVSEQKLRCHIYRRQMRATLQVPLTGVPVKLLFPITGKITFPLFTCTCIRKIPSWGKPAVSACEPAHWGSRKKTCRNYHATNKFKNNLKYFKIPTRTGLFSSYTVEDKFNDFHVFRLPSDTIEEKITELGGGPQWDRIPPMIVDMHDLLNYIKIKELSEIPENSYGGRSIFIVYSWGKNNRVAGFPLAARYHCGKINRVGVWASLKSDSADNYWILILGKPVCSLTLIVERILCVTLFIADTAAEKLTELGFWELSEAKFCTHPKSKIPLGIK